MTDIILAGIGQTDAGEHWARSLRSLAAEAARLAMDDSGGLRPQAIFVGNMFAPILSRQAHLGALVADFTDLTGVEAVTVEAAGASGAAALRQGFLAVKSGLVEVALVVGVEKFTDLVGAGVESALATTLDSDYEAVPGLTPSAQAALLMRRYQAEYAVPDYGLAGFPLTAHAHGAGNPHAMFQKAIRPETYAKAEMVSEPLNLFDMAPNADGAAAIILTRRNRLPKNYPHPLVRIAGAGLSTDMLAIHDRPDPLWFDAAHLSAARALKQAGASLDAVDFFEYHDSFSIYAALALEACGFASRGAGWKLAAEGAVALKGKFPCATMGGLKARGFTGGASGVYQAVEAALQLRGQAGKNQLERAQMGLIQALGGPASTAVTHLLERIEA